MQKVCVLMYCNEQQMFKAHYDLNFIFKIKSFRKWYGYAIQE